MQRRWGIENHPLVILLIRTAVILALIASTGCVTPGTRFPARDGNTHLRSTDANSPSTADSERQYLAQRRAAATNASSRSNAVKIADEIARRGLKLFSKGRYHLAAKFFDVAGNILETHGSKRDAALQRNNLSRVYNLMGNYSEAIQQAANAILLAEEMDDRHKTAMGHINLGWIYYNQREYKAAKQSLGSALELSRSAGHDDLTADALQVLGAVYRQSGDFERSRELYRQALKMNRALDRRIQAAACRRHLGELFLYRPQGDPDANLAKAADYLNRALQESRQAKDRLGAAMALSHLGEYHYKREDYPAAITRYKEAGQYFKQTGFRDGIGRMLIHRGFAQGDAGNLDAALTDFNDAIGIYDALEDREWLRVAWFGKAVVQEKKGAVQEALGSYKRAVDLFESIRAGEIDDTSSQRLFTRVNRRLYDNLIQLLLQQDDIPAALEYIERSRLRALREQMLQNWLHRDTTRSSNGDLTDQSVGGNLRQVAQLTEKQAQLQRAAAQTQDQETQQVLSEQVAENEVQVNRVFVKLIRSYPELEATLNIIPKTAALSSSPDFPANLAILTYFVGDQALYIFVTKKGEQVKAHRVDIDAARLNQHVKTAVRLIGANKNKSFGAPEAAGQPTLEEVLALLYRYLVAPADQDLKDIRTIALIPFGWLSYLPFGALMETHSDGRSTFLLESRHVVHLATHTYAERLWRMQPPAPGIAGQTIAAFGNPDTGDASDNLPFAEAEVKQIQQQFPGSRIFIGPEATKNNFIELWGRHRVLHVAAHGRLAANSPSISLAPGQAGVLAIEELLDLPPNQETMLVTLSACQTAVDPMLTRGLVASANTPAAQSAGMKAPMASAAHLLMLARVPNVIATLWNVSDMATADLMADYYRQLKKGLSFYTALREAQLAMIRRTDQLNQPYYWAAFLFMGVDK